MLQKAHLETKFAFNTMARKEVELSVQEFDR
jgi:hypothetical protein